MWHLCVHYEHHKGGGGEGFRGGHTGQRAHGSQSSRISITSTVHPVSLLSLHLVLLSCTVITHVVHMYNKNTPVSGRYNLIAALSRREQGPVSSETKISKSFVGEEQDVGQIHSTSVFSTGEPLCVGACSKPRP